MAKFSRALRLLVVLLATLVLASATPLAGRAEAQSSPFVAYGIGLEPGTTVTAIAGGIVCESVAADADGNWLIMIEASAPCAPEGRSIAFLVNGALSNINVEWSAGGTPETSGYPAETGFPLVMPAASTAPTTSAPATTAPTASTPAPPPATEAQVAPASAPVSSATSAGPAPGAAPALPAEAPAEISTDATLPNAGPSIAADQPDASAPGWEPATAFIESLRDASREVGATSIVTAVLLAVVGLSGTAWAVARFGRA